MLIKRFEKNPVLVPNKSQSWEAGAVFNGCPVKKDDKIFLLYRALSLPQHHSAAKTDEMMLSNIGVAESKNGVNFSKRKRFIFPEYSWEQFGCEDPRVTKLNGKYYIFYTALSHYPFRAEGIKIGLAISKDLNSVEEKHPVTPFNAKAMSLFPEKIKGKMWSVLTVNTDKPPTKICLASFDKEEEIWSEKYWEKWYENLEKNSISLKRNPEDHVEVGAPPVKTKHGWLLFYSYIQNYFSGNPVFSIEAVLLDLKNPKKVIAKTDMPLMVPERYYEKMGLVDDVVFPSGVFVEGDLAYLYYGAADTTCCLTFVSISHLIAQMKQTGEAAIKFSRYKKNPIIALNKENAWEAKATYNPAAIFLEGKVHLLYRAQAEDNTSVLGYARLKNGLDVEYQPSEPAYVPREDFEQKREPNAGSGCEDPRLTRFDDRIYMTYTAYNGVDRPRVALTSILVDDFLKQKWNWKKPQLISPPELNNKNACIFPEKVNGKYMIIHRTGNDIDISFHRSLNFKENEWLEEYRWIYPRRGMWDSKRIGAVSAPIKTEEGWILFYHGISERDGFYRVGAVLLDLKDPLKLITRTKDPLFEPETVYEKEGQVPNVVFPCGALAIGERIYIYYGGADQVIGVAFIDTKKLLKSLNYSRGRNYEGIVNL